VDWVQRNSTVGTPIFKLITRRILLKISKLARDWLVGVVGDPQIRDVRGSTVLG
jgi:hypothetical protein